MLVVRLLLPFFLLMGILISNIHVSSQSCVMTGLVEDAYQSDPCISLTTWALVYRHGRYSFAICDVPCMIPSIDNWNSISTGKPSDMMYAWRYMFSSQYITIELMWCIFFRTSIPRQRSQVHGHIQQRGKGHEGIITHIIEWTIRSGTFFGSS